MPVLCETTFDPELEIAAEQSSQSGSILPLIKKELKYKIQQRRVSEGIGELQVTFSKPPKYEVSASVCEYIIPLYLCFLPVCPKNWIRGHLVFVLSICGSVAKTLTLTITFEPYEIETSYLAYSTNETLSNDTKVNDLVRDLYTQNSELWTLLPPGAFVFHKHTRLYVYLFCFVGVGFKGINGDLTPNILP